MHSILTFAASTAFLTCSFVAALPQPPHQLPANISSLPFPAHLVTSGEPPNSTLSKRDVLYTGQLNAEWVFADQVGVGECGDGICGGEITPDFTLTIEFVYNGNSLSPNSCTEVIDITNDSLDNKLAGTFYWACNGNVLVIFDANSPGGTVATYGSAYGIQCGWVDSPAHSSSPGLDSVWKYYYSCYFEVSYS